MILLKSCNTIPSTSQMEGALKICFAITQERARVWERGWVSCVTQGWSGREGLGRYKYSQHKLQNWQNQQIPPQTCPNPPQYNTSHWPQTFKSASLTTMKGWSINYLEVFPPFYIPSEINRCFHTCEYFDQVEGGWWYPGKPISPIYWLPLTTCTTA